MKNKHILTSFNTNICVTNKQSRNIHKINSQPLAIQMAHNI